MSACHSPRIALHDFGSLPRAVPSWHCHLRYCNLCVHHPETAKLLTAPLLSDLWVWTPVIHTPPAPRHASQHLQCQGGSQVPPGDTCPLTEQPWPCATGRRWRSHSLWWKRCHCPNCSYNQKTLKCYCLPWKGWSPAKLLRLPYSLLAQIWGWAESFGVPAAVLLFCNVSLMYKQAKLPESVWVPSTSSHGSKKRASARPFFPKAGDYEGQWSTDLWPYGRQQWEVG